MQVCSLLTTLRYNSAGVGTLYDRVGGGEVCACLARLALMVRLLAVEPRPWATVGDVSTILQRIVFTSLEYSLWRYALSPRDYVSENLTARHRRLSAMDNGKTAA